MDTKTRLEWILERDHGLVQYLLSTYYAPGTVLGNADLSVNKTDKNLCHRLYILVGEADTKVCSSGEWEKGKWNNGTDNSLKEL